MNALVREFLTAIAQREDRAKKARQRIRKIEIPMSSERALEWIEQFEQVVDAQKLEESSGFSVKTRVTHTL